MTCTGWMGPPSTCCATWAGTGAGMAAGCCGFARCAGKDWSPGRCWPPSWPIWDGTCRLRRCRCRHSASRRPSSCLRPSSGRRSRAQGGEGSRVSPAPLAPPSVRALIQGCLAKLTQPARQLVMASAVLGTQASAKLLWQVAEVGVQAGVEALEEAEGLGILCEERAVGGLGVGQAGTYRFAHDLMRDVVYTELGAARRQVLHQRALARLESEGVRASELAYHARVCGEAEAAYGYSVQAGDEAMAVFAVADAIRHYQQGHALLQQSQPMQSGLPASEVDHLYASLGRAYTLQNAWQQAQLAYEELLAYGKQHQLAALVSMTLNRLAILAVQQSKDRSQVQARLQQAWQMAQTSSDQRALADTGGD